MGSRNAMTLLQEDIQIISSGMQFFHFFDSLPVSILVGIARWPSEIPSHTLKLLFCQLLQGAFPSRERLPYLIHRRGKNVIPPWVLRALGC